MGFIDRVSDFNQSLGLIFFTKTRTRFILGQRILDSSLNHKNLKDSDSSPTQLFHMRNNTRKEL